MRKKTVSCKKVWNEIKKLRTQYSVDTKALENAFCDFECAWKEHAKEYHGDDLNEVRK